MLLGGKAPENCATVGASLGCNHIIYLRVNVITQCILDLLILYKLYIAPGNKEKTRSFAPLFRCNRSVYADIDSI